jgi:hypothetical protein
VDEVSINFIELVALTRIKPDSTVEKFGSLINSSFFDASNILAGLKTKGLVDFITAFPSQSVLKATDMGTALIAEAGKKAEEPLDALDYAMLAQLAGGRRSLADLGGALNVAQTDLAMHIYKLSAQQNLTYEIVNATVSMYLTEKGFVAARNQSQGVAPQPEMQPSAQQVAPAQVSGGAAPQATGAPAAVGADQRLNDEIKVLEEISRKRRQRKRLMIVIIAAVVAALVIFVVLDGIIPI